MTQSRYKNLKLATSGLLLVFGTCEIVFSFAAMALLAFGIPSIVLGVCMLFYRTASIESFCKERRYSMFFAPLVCLILAPAIWFGLPLFGLLPIWLSGIFSVSLIVATIAFGLLPKCRRRATTALFVVLATSSGMSAAILSSIVLAKVGIFHLPLTFLGFLAAMPTNYLLLFVLFHVALIGMAFFPLEAIFSGEEEKANKEIFCYSGACLVVFGCSFLAVLPHSLGFPWLLPASILASIAIIVGFSVLRIDACLGKSAPSDGESESIGLDEEEPENANTVQVVSGAQPLAQRVSTQPLLQIGASANQQTAQQIPQLPNDASVVYPNNTNNTNVLHQNIINRQNGQPYVLPNNKIGSTQDNYSAFMANPENNSAIFGHRQRVQQGYAQGLSDRRQNSQTGSSNFNIDAFACNNGWGQYGT